MDNFYKDILTHYINQSIGTKFGKTYGFSMLTDLDGIIEFSRNNEDKVKCYCLVNEGQDQSMLSNVITDEYYKPKENEVIFDIRQDNLVSVRFLLPFDSKI